MVVEGTFVGSILVLYVDAYAVVDEVEVVLDMIALAIVRPMSVVANNVVLLFFEKSSTSMCFYCSI